MCLCVCVLGLTDRNAQVVEKIIKDSLAFSIPNGAWRER